MPNQNEWDRQFLCMAFMSSRLSKDPSTKVGAVLVTPDNRSVSMGYNGFPEGTDDSPKNWERPIKYERVIHAEVNAILNCGFTIRGCTLYCTLAPCHRCMGQILQAGVTRVVYYDDYDRMEHPDIREEFSKHFLEFIRYPQDDFIDQVKLLVST